MNNQELLQKLENILAEENILNMLEKASDFKKEYKNTLFYKNTKIELLDLLKMIKTMDLFNPQLIGKKIQSIIDNLSFDNLQEIFNQTATLFQNENKDTLEILDRMKELNIK